MSELGGIPIEGYIMPTHGVVDQDPIEYFVDALRGVFTTGVIKAVKWAQYTPYFNDGEPCVFTIHEPYFRFADLDDYDDGGDYEDGYLSSYEEKYQRILGGDKWNRETRSYDRIEGEDPVTGALVKSFEDVLNSGRHTVELGRIFGDHAKVIATPDKFLVESYDHD
jgi:hypothetical protein